MRPLQSSRDTKSQEASFIRAVTKRDGYRCMMRTWSSMFPEWTRCGKEAHDTAHVIPRAQCGKARFDADVGIKLCRRCHDLFDGREKETNVRIKLPAGVYERALKCVNRLAKVKLVV